MAHTDMVRVAIFENEPLARMWEETLRQEGIPCVAQVLEAGPGGLRQASSMPYGLYVPAAEASRAREAVAYRPEEGLAGGEFVAEAPALWSLLAWPLLQRILAGALLLVFLSTAAFSLAAVILR